MELDRIFGPDPLVILRDLDEEPGRGAFHAVQMGGHAPFLELGRRDADLRKEGGDIGTHVRPCPEVRDGAIERERKMAKLRVELEHPGLHASARMAIAPDRAQVGMELGERLPGLEDEFAVRGGSVLVELWIFRHEGCEAFGRVGLSDHDGAEHREAAELSRPAPEVDE